MPKRINNNLYTLFNELDAEKDLVNLLSFYYKKIISMNSDELAYEYLRRNPLFISDILKDFKEMETSDNINNFIFEIKYDYQKKYLYNPIDIYAKLYNFEDISIDRQLTILTEKSKKYQGAFKDFRKEGETKKSVYVNLYNVDINNNNEVETDAYRHKQKNAIPLEGLFKPIETQRWLGWLRPSINIELFPNKNKDELKQALQKMLTLFDTNETLTKMNHISAPNYLLDYFNIDKFQNESLLLDIKSPRDAAMKLFWFDAKYIFNYETDFSFAKLREIFDLVFRLDKHDFDQYIDISNKHNNIKDNNYEHIFSLKAKKAISEATTYIYGDYLKLIYPKVSIREHFFAVKDILDCKSLFFQCQYKSILEVSEEEYQEYYKILLNQDKETRIKIIQHIFRSPLDIIDDIKTQSSKKEI